MNDFSLLDINLSKRAEELELAKLFTPAPPWSAEEATKKAVQKRRKAAASFEKFDRVYFPPESYGDSYAPANAFHSHVAACCLDKDRTVNVVVGPHDHAKSATVYKVLIWLALYGRKHFVGIASETLETPRNLITALSHFVKSNARIQHDWPDIEFLSDSQERLHITTHDNPRGTVFQGYSEEKSTRGKNTGLFFRFDLLVVEDLENRNSSMTKAAVEKRLTHLAEFQSSLAESGCMMVTANNFDERCAINQLVKRFPKGELEDSWAVWVFPAWGRYYDSNGKFVLRSAHDKRNETLTPGPLWQERYAAESEADLRRMLRPFDNATWKGSYQGMPQPPAGDFFSREFLFTYSVLPDDLTGVYNTDQNLAKKGKGDKTAMGLLSWSDTTQKLYASGMQYRSYHNSNDTFDDMRMIMSDGVANNINIVAAGMEGHVNQESHWQQHIENYMARNAVMMPPIYFHRYQIEMEAKQAQLLWSSGKILFDEAWIESEEGQAFRNDLLAFTGRKLAGARDDAPDWLIKSVKMLIELYVVVDLDAPGIMSPKRSLTKGGRLNFGGSRLGRM